MSWITSEGKLINIKDMSDTHLLRSKRKLDFKLQLDQEESTIQELKSTSLLLKQEIENRGLIELSIDSARNWKDNFGN